MLRKTLFGLLLTGLCFIIAACGGGGGGNSGGGGGGGGNQAANLPNVGLTAVTFTPANPVVGQLVTGTITGTYLNVQQDTTITVTVDRRENDAIVATLWVLLHAGAGTFTTTFTFTSEAVESFYIAADTGNSLVESDESDNNLANVAVQPVTGLAADFAVTQRSGVWIARLSNVQAHFGKTIVGNQVFLNSDTPAAIAYGTVGQALTIDANGGVEWAVDTRRLGNFRLGVKAKCASCSGNADMYMLASTLEGNPFLKNVDGLAERNLSYRVVTTATGRQVGPVVGASVGIRSYMVGSDPAGTQTTADQIDTDLYVDAFQGAQGTLYVESVKSHLVSGLPPSTGTIRGVMRVDPLPTDLYSLTNSDITATYSVELDQLSIDLFTTLTISADHFVQVGLQAGAQTPVIVDSLSFGRKVDGNGSTIPTHSLIDPSIATKLIHLRWNNTTRRWGTAR